MSEAARPMPGLPPSRPISMRERAAILFLEKDRLDVMDGAFVLVDDLGVRVHIPIGDAACSPAGGDASRV
jgi:CRISP-associated protein Cas1